MVLFEARSRLSGDGVDDSHAPEGQKGSAPSSWVIREAANTVEDAAQMLADSGADGALIGRGTYGRPWFPNQVWHYLQTGEKLPDPAIELQLATVLEHYETILSHYGVSPGVRIARKHLGWYSKGLPKSTEYRALVNSLDDPQQVKDEIHRFYGPLIERMAA